MSVNQDMSCQHPYGIPFPLQKSHSLISKEAVKRTQTDTTTDSSSSELSLVTWQDIIYYDKTSS